MQLRQGAGIDGGPPPIVGWYREGLMGKLLDETESLNHHAALCAAARLLAERIEGSALTGAGTLAQEVAQYRQTMAEIRALPLGDRKVGGNVISADEARLRRAVRVAAAEAQSATN